MLLASPINNTACNISKSMPYCPSRSRLTVSFENEEKVVKPPKNPVAKKSLHSIVIFPLSLKPKTIPIRKQPIIFTAQGSKRKGRKKFILYKLRQQIPGYTADTTSNANC